MLPDLHTEGTQDTPNHLPGVQAGASQYESAIKMNTYGGVDRTNRSCDWRGTRHWRGDKSAPGEDGGCSGAGRAERRPARWGEGRNRGGGGDGRGFPRRSAARGGDSPAGRIDQGAL